MRYINALFIVVLLLLMGCSSTPDQLVEKTTSTPIIIDISGSIHWDAMPNPMLDLRIDVYNVTKSQPEDYYMAPQDPDGYTEENFELSTSGDNYRFTPDPPSGYHIVGTLSYQIDNVTTNVTGIDFDVAED